MLSHKGLSFDQQRQKICMRRVRNANTSLVWAELHIGPQDSLHQKPSLQILSMDIISFAAANSRLDLTPCIK